MKHAPLHAAMSFIKQEYPHCEAAYLGGSTASGLASTTSDLDLVIIDSSEPVPYQWNTRRSGWLIEAFVLTPDTYRIFFAEAQKQALPTLIRMCAEGIILHGGERAQTIQEEALTLLRQGPEEWSFGQIDRSRYDISECLSDLEGCQNEGELWFIVQHLAGLLESFLLRAKGHWTGIGKWAYRELSASEKAGTDAFLSALQRFYHHSDPAPLIEFADRALSPYGGRLYEGRIETNLPLLTEEK